MRIPVVVLTILVALCGVVLSLWFVPEPAASRGVDHPDLSTMQQGGSTERHRPVLVHGWLYGALSIALFVGLIALGLRRRGRLPRGGAAALVAGFVLVLFVFTLLLLSYAGYAAPGAERPLFGSFPVPTAWMLYGIWTLPAVFCLLYMAKFDQWVMSDRDVEEFDRLVLESRRSRFDSGRSESS